MSFTPAELAAEIKKEMSDFEILMNQILDKLLQILGQQVSMMGEQRRLGLKL
jgi:hypothetical protein